MRCHFFSGMGRIVDKQNTCIHPYGFLGRGIQGDHSLATKNSSPLIHVFPYFENCGYHGLGSAGQAGAGGMAAQGSSRNPSRQSSSRAGQHPSPSQGQALPQSRAAACKYIRPRQQSCSGQHSRRRRVSSRLARAVNRHPCLSRSRTSRGTCTRSSMAFRSGQGASSQLGD